MATALDGLKASGTLVVADTGEFSKIAALSPADATTNPSLILAAAQRPEYSALLDDAVAYARAGAPSGGPEQMELALDKLAVNFGVEIAKLVPGYVSTEVDARLSFDRARSLARARRISALYRAAGVPPERVLIKLASTWECIQAAEELEREGIRCNLTLLFCFEQAAACAFAKVTLISPFVGRIYDWHKAKNGGADIPAAEDPGVHSVKRIYNFFRKAGIATIVMGASFRSVEQILALAGCDRLTISPALIDKLAALQAPVPVALSPAAAAADATVPATCEAITEADFRFALNENPMASDKLAEGIRGFSADLRKLEALLAPRLA